VLELINRLPNPNTVPIEEIIVMHSHHHRDHYAGDEQFAGQQKITLVAPDRESLTSQFGLPVAATHEAELNLGGRKIKLIPIPGHQGDSVALFDQQTGWLLTGDTLYPGSIRVADWDQFKLSINRLSAFTEQHQVSAILGGHVEMRSDMPKIYPIGSTFQPKELPLGLRVDELVELNEKLAKTKKTKTLRFQKLIISPLNFFERQLMKVLSHNGAQPKVLKPEAFSKVGASLETDLSRLALCKGLSTDQRANPFISHQFQQQSVIHSPVDYV
jgi:hydroxyacylglutathione hydrolase